MATSRKSTTSRSKAAKKRARPKRVSKPAAKRAAKRGAKRTPKRTAKSTPKRATKKPAAPRARKPAAKAHAGGKRAPDGAATARGSARPAVPAARGRAARRREVRPDTNAIPLGVLPASARAREPHPAAPVAAAPEARRRGTPPVSQQGIPGITPADYPEFEERLLDLRRRILKEMGHLETTLLKVNPRDSSGDLSGYSFHMADAGTDSMEREKAFLFASTEGRALLEVDEALRRLRRGEYGMCESCGQPIGRPRLEAMPAARLCVTCKEKEERSGRGGQ